MLSYLLLVVYLAVPVLSLDNGLALTPPMGWLTWQRFRCNIDCDNDPDNCIGEKLIKDMADRMAADGFLNAGYEYIMLDDCWLAKDRAADGQLQADPKRFPSGIKSLADYVHSKGLKFGIYEDFGTKTCVGYPGSEYYMEMDAQTFADWGVDFLKFDACYSDVHQYDDGFPIMSNFLNRTKRPMVFSCAWPKYQELDKIKPNYPRVAEYCNLWRSYIDIDDSWETTSKILGFYGDNTTGFVQVAGPGQWNDPDMLLLGNFGLSYEQERTQMAMWCLMASPLIMSVDLRTIRQSSKDLLLNPQLLAINQDKLGKQGARISKSGNIQVWTKPLTGDSMAFAYINFGADGMPRKVSMALGDMGLTKPTGYNISEAFNNKFIGTFRPADTFSAQVNPTGIFLGWAKPL